MLVPAMIYGFYPEVERRTKRMIHEMARGVSFEQAIGMNNLVDTHDHPGLLVLSAPNRFLGIQPHFHINYPLRLILEGMTDENISKDTEDIIFHTCLRSVWGVLLLLPYDLTEWVRPSHRWVPFLCAAARCWPIFEAEGARYTYGSVDGQALAEDITTVDYVLVNSGIIPASPNYRRPPNWPALVEAYAAPNPPVLH